MSQPLDSRQLRAFVALAKTRSFTRAGQQLFLSQSAVSHTIKALESDLGCRLFDRLGKQVHLTPTGEHLLHHAERILGEMLAARDSIAQRHRWGKGRLRIAVCPSISDYLLPVVLPKLTQQFPDAIFSFELADANAVSEPLQTHAVDLALGLAPVENSDIEFSPLFTDELSFVLVPDHPWVTRGGAARTEISRQRFILPGRSTRTFQLIERYFRRDGISLKGGLHVDSPAIARELIKGSFGPALLPVWAVRRELENQTLAALPLGQRKLKRSWGILRSSGHKPSLAETAFVDLCRAFGSRATGQ